MEITLLVKNQVVIKEIKKNRLQFYSICAVCRSKKVRYVKENGQVGTGKKTGTGRKTGKGRKTKRKSKKLFIPRAAQLYQLYRQ